MAKNNITPKAPNVTPTYTRYKKCTAMRTVKKQDTRYNHLKFLATLKNIATDEVAKGITIK